MYDRDSAPTALIAASDHGRTTLDAAQELNNQFRHGSFAATAGAHVADADHGLIEFDRGLAAAIVPLVAARNDAPIQAGQ
jgi:hypothetical protein